MTKLLFADRVKVEKLFEMWCLKNKVRPTMDSMVAFLEHQGWLDCKKILEDTLQIEFA